MTPLSWCIVVSTAANVAIAAMVGWFLLIRPVVNVGGYVSIAGGVRVDGGTIGVRPTDDDDAIFKVQLCEQTTELSQFNLPPNNKREMIRATHCASLDQTTSFGIKSYGLSVILPTR
jgi:hypothetical protein